MKRLRITLDTRSFDQFSTETIQGTKNIVGPCAANLDQFAGKKIIFHCNKGGGSGRHANAIVDSLPYDIYNLAGGIQAWKEAGLATVAGSADDVIAGADSEVKSCSI